MMMMPTAIWTGLSSTVCTVLSAATLPLVVAVPVFRSGQVIGAVGFSVFLKDLSAIIAEELKLADDIIFYAVTPGDQVALHTNTELILEESPQPPKSAVTRTASFTGWRITLGYK